MFLIHVLYMDTGCACSGEDVNCKKTVKKLCPLLPTPPPFPLPNTVLYSPVAVQHERHHLLC